MTGYFMRDVVEDVVKKQIQAMDNETFAGFASEFFEVDCTYSGNEDFVVENVEDCKELEESIER